MMTPEERYQRDPMFRGLVDYTHSLLERAMFTPTELREAVILAAIQHSMRCVKPTRFLVDELGDLEASVGRKR